MKLWSTAMDLLRLHQLNHWCISEEKKGEGRLLPEGIGSGAGITSESNTIPPPLLLLFWAPSFIPPPPSSALPCHHSCIGRSFWVLWHRQEDSGLLTGAWTACYSKCDLWSFFGHHCQRYSTRSEAQYDGAVKTAILLEKQKAVLQTLSKIVTDFEVCTIYKIFMHQDVSVLFMIVLSN